MILWLLACLPPAGTADPTLRQPDLTVPELDDFEMTCDVERGRWRVEADATSWTGGGLLLWTLDHAYFESHNVPSIEIAEDGTRDRLRLDINILSDWRQAEQGQTSFRCLEDPDVVFYLLDSKANPTDCRLFGPDPEAWDALPGWVACDELIDVDFLPEEEEEE